MQLPIGFANLEPHKLVILALVGLGVVAVPITLAIGFWVVFCFGHKDTKGNE